MDQIVRWRDRESECPPPPNYKNTVQPCLNYSSTNYNYCNLIPMMSKCILLCPYPYLIRCSKVFELNLELRNLLFMLIN